MEQAEKESCDIGQYFDDIGLPFILLFMSVCYHQEGINENFDIYSTSCYFASTFDRIMFGLVSRLI
jgi:hypothetical protein